MYCKATSVSMFLLCNAKPYKTIVELSVVHHVYTIIKLLKLLAKIFVLNMEMLLATAQATINKEIAAVV